MKKMKIGFERVAGKNRLVSAEPAGAITVSCETPAGASEHYGYLSLKRAMLEDVTCILGIGEECVEWPFDAEQERLMEDDADAACDISAYFACGELRNAGFDVIKEDGPADYVFVCGAEQEGERG